MKGALFSFGAVLARRWPEAPAVAPWAAAATILIAAAMWDWTFRGAPVDFVLLGLAGYELVVGLTEESAARRPALQQVRR